MKFESIMKRLSTLEEAYSESAFSVILERAIFRKGSGRVVGTILVKPGTGGYVAV